MPQLDNSSVIRSLAEAAQDTLQKPPAKPPHLGQDESVAGGSPANGPKGDQSRYESNVLGAKDPFEKVVTISVHDNSTSPNVLLNGALFQDKSIQDGALMQIRELHTEGADGLFSDASLSKSTAQSLASDNAYIFFAKFANSDILSKLPNMQISVPKPLSETLRLSKNAPVAFSRLDEKHARASHVELVFRDQYLARADMWRLIKSQLAGQCIFRGQKVELMNTIKVIVKAIFINGTRVTSALFHASTKPIFRSESARYVLFIQMSKEMWEFDAEGNGEIMFDKVVGGFLPELFRRWKQMQVRHLISIVLFTRMEYDDRASNPLTSEQDGSQNRAEELQTKDFYRVVVSDMASIESASILDRLKREFQVFERDVSLRKPVFGEYAPLGTGLAAASAELPAEIIMGRPTTASRGNILEAINLASSQFSSDYVDRDLVRTGVSIVLISPGTGLFEVDYSLLVSTTENLTDNGVGIDLVCLARMPLHSVPLFRYNQPLESRPNDRQPGESATSTTPILKHSNTMNFGTPTSMNQASSRDNNTTLDQNGRWSYGIPHWVDISFWTVVEDEFGSADRASIVRSITNGGHDVFKYKPFKPRVRIYELQMMGVMENSWSENLVPRLPPPSDVESLPDIKGSLQPTLSRKPSMAQGSKIGSFASGSLREPRTTDFLAMSSYNSASNRLDMDVTSRWMDAYDDRVFRSPKAKKNIRHNQHRYAGKRSNPLQPKKLSAPRSSDLKDITALREDLLETNTKFRTSGEPNSTITNVSGHTKNKRSLISTLHSTSHKPALSSRKISFGPRGFGVATPTAAAAIATTDAVDRHGDTRLRANRPGARESMPTGNDLSSDKADHVDERELSRPQDSTNPPEASTRSVTSTAVSEFEGSRPIPIKKGPTIEDMDDHESIESEDKELPLPQDRVATLKDVSQIEGTEEAEIYYGPNLPTLSPSTTLAPWLTVLNPCNPSKYMMTSTNRLGRWQHIFPRPLKTSQMKWKSLCCPAAVPLTTEDFPTADRLADEYRERSWVIHLPEEMDLSLHPRSLTNELIAFRLSRGFQIVVGDRIADVTNDESFKDLDVFNERVLAEVGSQIYMSRGSTIHCLKRTAADRLEVKTFSRHTILRPVGLGDDAYLHYTPLIRSMLADTYEDQAISTSPQRGVFNWEYIDSFIAGYERPKAEQYVEQLRPWRARFILIPMESSANSRRPSRSKELTEEEIRLEGIKRLTQFWQKCRYILPEERRFTKTTRVKEDANPLDVQYFTKNPSAVVSEELHNAIGGDTGTAAVVQLLPETDLLQKSGLNTKYLAEKLQSDKGVQIVDRRWHWKLHHYCFVGSELTTWLLENFKDIKSREEAVDLGNELMQDGLFRHVERRHDFRDGHYFYQIIDDYRGPRSESKGFFGWAKASVPPPFKEASTSESHSLERTLSNSDLTNSENVTALITESKQRPSVALGRSLIYNLVHSRQKTSYREELMNVHYDRLHNPDNCYHIRIEWMNATPKLIQDAVNHWAMMMEAYGLRLVEVPIGEASSISSRHPFRSPYLITLAREPPMEQPLSQFDSKKFLSQRQVAHKYFFQQAILKRFNFVLDFEAASDFPPDVDVTYSWGKPDYRYPQYIHRSGLLIAQITDKGQFLILANRLYNNKSSSARAKTFEDDDHIDRSPVSHRTNPLRAGDALTQRSSPKGSPFSSPAPRAALDVPETDTPSHRRPLSHVTSSYQIPCHSTSSGESSTDPEKLTRNLQAFCDNAETLDGFYAEQSSKPSSSVPNTPSTSARQTPMNTPDRTIEDSNIPDLTLPGSLTEQQKNFGGAKRWRPGSSKGDGSPSSKSTDRRSTIGEKSPLSHPQ